MPERDGKDFDLVGPVDDLAGYFDQARVVVVPTRFAAGIPHKVHQSAALGVPVVATDLIAGQVGWENGRELLAAEDAEGFADACARLFTDEALWQRLRRAALERCRQDCSPEPISRARSAPSSRPSRRAHARQEGESVALAKPVLAPAYVGRAAETDYSAAVPFGYVPSPTSRPASVAVVCHLFHAELAEEFRHYLRNIPVPADIFLSTDTDAKRATVARAFEDWGGGSGRAASHAQPRPRHRAQAGRVQGRARALSTRPPPAFQKSAHDEVLAPWRTFLLENLLGSPAIVRSVFEVFARSPRIGMIFPSTTSTSGIGWIGAPTFQRPSGWPSAWA